MDRELVRLARALSSSLRAHRDLLRVADAHGVSLVALTGDEPTTVDSLRRLPLQAVIEIDRALAHVDRGVDHDAVVQVALTADTSGSKLAYIERLLIDHVIRHSGGNQSEAARLLGIDRKALARKLARQRRA